MKKIILALIAFTALTACNKTKEIKLVEPPKELIDNSVEPNTIQQTTSNNLTPVNGNKVDEPAIVILGTWTGEMSGKKLTIVVEKINGNELIGYNILGSNRRNLKGTFTDGSWDQPCSKAYESILNEPGDDKWDGVFTVKFVGYEDQKDSDNGIECEGNLKGQEAQGEWKSNNGKLKKDFSLVRQK
jgi:hypothetical protein